MLNKSLCRGNVALKKYFNLTHVFEIFFKDICFSFIFRALGPGIVNSTNAIHDEMYLHRSALSVRRILPSYSSVLKMGPPPKMQSVCSSCSFVPRKPPPSYAEVEGIWEDSPSLISCKNHRILSVLLIIDNSFFFFYSKIKQKTHIKSSEYILKCRK